MPLVKERVELRTRSVTVFLLRGCCTVVCRAIFLALSTPQDRVNQDLDSWLAWAGDQDGVDGTSKTAVMGFCYGGGKALRYVTSARPDAAPVVFYGTPLTDAADFASLRAPVCGCFGEQDLQIPPPAVSAFRAALEVARAAQLRAAADDAMASVAAEAELAQMSEAMAAWSDEMASARRGEEGLREAMQAAMDRSE